tara:strand:- start:1058 stop:1417 length:360 start_codon:yes stop_codon:yes gene_type:complete
MLFDLISTNPVEIKEIIFFYISDNVKSNLTKKWFILNYENKIKQIPFYNSYMRYVIRNKHEFILTLNLELKKRSWHNLKNWRYNNRIFSNYIGYLKYYATKQNKNKMYQIIKSIETKRE